MGKSTEPLKTRQYVTAETLTKLFSGQDKAKKQRPKSSHGIIRCRPKNSEAVGMRSGAHGGLMCPLEKGVRGIETSGSGYLRQQIRGGHKGRAERQGLGAAPQYKKKRVLRRTSEDSLEERQLPTLPPGLAVPSAMTGLASLFGMGRGGSPSL